MVHDFETLDIVKNVTQNKLGKVLVVCGNQLEVKLPPSPEIKGTVKEIWDVTELTIELNELQTDDFVIKDSIDLYHYAIEISGLSDDEYDDLDEDEMIEWEDRVLEKYSYDPWMISYE